MSPSGNLSISSRRSDPRGFNLIELIIVVVLIGIIAAVAIPRLSRGSAASGDSQLAGNLAVLRSAIDLYATEHGGTYPAVDKFDGQMTQYTDAQGNVSPAKTSTVIFGPYLRKTPILPIGANKGSASVVDGATGSPGATAGAWFYNATTGTIQANCPDSELDEVGKKYNAY
jgi:prepilin-type N-terminal cleavage/methylation domain-containing protein